MLDVDDGQDSVVSTVSFAQKSAVKKLVPVSCQTTKNGICENEKYQRACCMWVRGSFVCEKQFESQGGGFFRGQQSGGDKIREWPTIWLEN